MSDITVTAQPAIRQRVADRDPSKRGRVTGKLRTALLSVVHEGAEPFQAARQVGLNPHAMRLALQKPHVLAFLRQQREVLRATASAQNIHHAIALRDSAENAMARLGAMKFIEGIDEAKQLAASRAQQPGFMIVVHGQPQITSMRETGPNTLIEHEPVSQPAPLTRDDET